MLQQIESCHLHETIRRIFISFLRTYIVLDLNKSPHDHKIITIYSKTFRQIQQKCVMAILSSTYVKKCVNEIFELSRIRHEFHFNLGCKTLMKSRGSQDAMERLFMRN